MISAKLLPLLAGTAAAQSTILALTNAYISNNTVTQMESNPTATTYVMNCPKLPAACESAYAATSTANLKDVIESIRSSDPNPCSAVSGDFEDLCAGYTFVQGPQTYSFHHEMGDLYSMDIKCDWKEEMTTADFTCAMTAGGFAFESESASGIAAPSVTTETLNRKVIADETLLVPFTVVTPTGGVKTTLAPTGSNTAGNAQNTSNSAGLGPAGPLPTGFIGFVGSAAAVLAAAVAL